MKYLEVYSSSDTGEAPRQLEATFKIPYTMEDRALQLMNRLHLLIWIGKVLSDSDLYTSRLGQEVVDKDKGYMQK